MTCFCLILQSIHNDSEKHTKTWRLQTDTTTWDEHIFEVNLPTSVYLGHLDVHFVLHTAATQPRVEITLLHQVSSNIGHRRDVKFAVDDSVQFDALQTENPVTSQEYLRTHNADILAGPVEIGEHLDLNEASGCVTLTSPKLFKSRNRTLLLHIKAVNSKDEESSSSNQSGTCKMKTCEPITTMSQNGTRKTEFYMGCDCLHELSVTPYVSTRTDVLHERSHRNAMLESNVFIQSLVSTAVNADDVESRNWALDLLNWIGSIRMTRNRSCDGDSPSYQKEFLKMVKGSLKGLLKKCLLLAGRGVAHKCIKLMIICSR